MSDLIEREDAIKAVKSVSENYTGKGKRDYHPHIDFIVDELKYAVPSADRPSGEWMPKNSHTMYCDVCGFEEVEWRTQDYGYCPHCGSKMRGEHDD